MNPQTVIEAIIVVALICLVVGKILKKRRGKAQNRPKLSDPFGAIGTAAQYQSPEAKGRTEIRAEMQMIKSKGENQSEEDKKRYWELMGKIYRPAEEKMKREKSKEEIEQIYERYRQAPKK